MTVPKRFGVLRFLAALLRVLAWVVLILTLLGAIFIGINSFTSILRADNLVTIPVLGTLLSLVGAGAGGIIAAVIAALGGLLYFVLLMAAAESLSLNLAVEENTRLTAALLLRMHQESQPDTRTSYSSTYASEPFEG